MLTFGEHDLLEQIAKDIHALRVYLVDGPREEARARAETLKEVVREMKNLEGKGGDGS